MFKSHEMRLPQKIIRYTQCPMRKSLIPDRVLVTGGPTRAYLDPVRYLTNFSTGALAFEISQALCRRGFRVVVVAGPTAQSFEKLPLAGFVRVETTEQMRRCVLRFCKSFHPFAGVFAAAVLDFAPEKIERTKVSSKKSWSVRFRATPKIIDEVHQKFPSLRRIGFKLEWRSPSRRDAFVIRYMQEKQLDGLCLNFLSQIRGKAHPALLYFNDGTFSRAKSKQEIAGAVVNYVLRAGGKPAMK